MKLPDFYSYAPLERLRGLMQADRVSLHFSVMHERTTSEEQRKLSESGIIIEYLDDICELEDGTLAYKDRRILLYIRDVETYEPRFHVSWCAKMDDMKTKGRFERYVISNNTDGVFEVRYKKNNYQPKQRRLKVCQYCLDKLRYDGFVWKGLGTEERKDKVGRFQLQAFFSKYPISPLNSKPKPRHTSGTAPLNKYSSGWERISKSYRAAKNWRCEECGKDCSKNKEELHTHHINGVKSDNREKKFEGFMQGLP